MRIFHRDFSFRYASASAGMTHRIFFSSSGRLGQSSSAFPMSIVFRAPRRYRETSQAELGDNISCDGKKELIFLRCHRLEIFSRWEWEMDPCFNYLKVQDEDSIGAKYGFLCRAVMEHWLGRFHAAGPSKVSSQLCVQKKNSITARKTFPFLLARIWVAFKLPLESGTDFEFLDRTSRHHIPRIPKYPQVRSQLGT